MRSWPQARAAGNPFPPWAVDASDSIGETPEPSLIYPVPPGNTIRQSPRREKQPSSRHRTPDKHKRQPADDESHIDEFA